jgi:hypothetical protein
MPRQSNAKEKVPSSSTIAASLASTGDAQSLTLRDTGGDLYLVRFCLRDLA